MLTDGQTSLQVHGHCNLTRLTPQAHFKPITPSYPNPNLTLTSLNMAVQIANLITYLGHVRTDAGVTGIL